MNKFFIGFFTVLTILAGIATYTPRAASKGDFINNLAHTAALENVTQTALAVARKDRQAREERAVSYATRKSIRWGSSHSSSSNISYGGSYSRSSYRGGK